MPKILVDLTDEEYRVLAADAKTSRRTAQAQAAFLLCDLLDQRSANLRLVNRMTEPVEARPQPTLPEADGGAGGPAAGLSPEERMRPVQGHRDGP